MSVSETPYHKHEKWVSLDDIEKECTLLPTDARETTVSRAIFTSILRANGISESRYRIHILDHEKSLEVKHTENGDICIPLALYRKAKTHDALAFIFAHELAHHINGDVESTRALLEQRDLCEAIQVRERNADITWLDLYRKRWYDTSLAIQFVKELEKDGGTRDIETCHVDPKERLKLLARTLPKKRK